MSSSTMIPDSPIRYGLFSDTDGDFHARPLAELVKQLPGIKVFAEWDTLAYAPCVRADAKEHMQRLGLIGELHVYEVHIAFTKEELYAPVKGFRVRR